MLTRRESVMMTALAALASSFGLPADAAGTTITIADSPLPNALDMFYAFLTGLAASEANAGSKVLLNNTITSFDIATDTPYYNEELFRNYADRVYKTSPASIGPSNVASRFSLHYERLMHAAVSKIDQRRPGLSARIAAYQAALNKETEKYTQFVLGIDSEWAKVAKKEGLNDPTDLKYQLRHINYLEGIHYADLINQYSLNISGIIGQMDAARREVYSTSEQLLLDVLVGLLESNKLTRPLRPNFERTAKVTEITFADPTLRVGAICDTSPSILPNGDLVNFLKLPGSRAIPKILKSSTSTDHHDSHWAGHASASFPLFSIPISGGVGGNGASGYTNTVKSLNSIGIAFDSIDEIEATRGGWFDPSLFLDASLVKIFKTIPEYDLLKYYASHLIIARGISVTLTFDTTVDAKNWSNQTVSANGGISLFGIGFSTGGSSTYNNWTVTASQDLKTLTFKDDPLLARLLAIRVVPIDAPNPKTNHLFELRVPLAAQAPSG
jgi:hypothetical protein